MLSALLQSDFAQVNSYAATPNLNPAIFIAGWYEGISGYGGHLDQITGCYQPNDVLTSTLIGAMSAAIAG